MTLRSSSEDQPFEFDSELRDTWDEIPDSKLPTVFAVPPRVAIAEDDEDLRTLLARSFIQEGYTVDALADGHALMAYLEAIMAPDGPPAPDAIISDVRMPGHSAFDVLELLADVAWDLPFVVITAFSDSSTRACAAMLGAVRLLDKPFAIDELKQVVQSALVHRELGRR